MRQVRPSLPISVDTRMNSRDASAKGFCNLFSQELDMQNSAPDSCSLSGPTSALTGLIQDFSRNEIRDVFRAEIQHCKDLFLQA